MFFIQRDQRGIPFSVRFDAGRDAHRLARYLKTRGWAVMVKRPWVEVFLQDRTEGECRAAISRWVWDLLPVGALAASTVVGAR